MRDVVVLSFDVGTHKIGVAIGQTLTQQAKPLRHLIAKKGRVEPTTILNLIHQWRPSRLLVGLPVQMDGRTQFTTDLALNFATFLREVTQLPTDMVDERLTTKAARSDLYDQGGYKKLKSADVDSYAAKLIAESWLRENVNL